jgi:hypothetical protein
MPRGTIAILAGSIGLGWVLAFTSTAAAADPEDVKFETYDRVELVGSFYPGKKSEPCVLILPRYGSSYKEEDWDQLAAALQKTGCAVLMFDYRGHGESTVIKKPERFWEDPTNRGGVRGFNPQNLKAKIGHKDFSREYIPHLVNDIAAARMFLDRKNDAGQCNSRSIILVGGEDGGVLGSMWAYSELYRFKVKGGKLPDPEASDVMGCVWLSMTAKLPANSEQATQALAWLTDAAGKGHNIPMAFFHGDGDTAGKRFANQAITNIKPDKNNKVTIEHAIKDSKLKGAKLLDKDLTTQSDILTYVKALKDEKGVTEWDTKETKKNAYVWLFKNGAQIVAKEKDEDNFAPLYSRLLQP